MQARYTTEFEQSHSGAAARGRRALITLLVGGVIGAAIGWSAGWAALTPSASGIAVPAGPMIDSPAIAAPLASRVQTETPVRRSIVVVIPGEQDFVRSSTIAIAGMAYGRPHGPRVRSVQVELYVEGKLVDRADLEVFSSRFAGVIELPTPVSKADAELRISDPTRSSGPIVVRSFTIDAPLSALAR
jgi:hypothetical protein